MVMKSLLDPSIDWVRASGVVIKAVTDPNPYPNRLQFPEFSVLEKSYISNPYPYPTLQLKWITNPNPSPNPNLSPN